MNIEVQVKECEWRTCKCTHFSLMESTEQKRWQGEICMMFGFLCLRVYRPDHLGRGKFMQIGKNSNVPRAPAKFFDPPV